MKDRQQVSNVLLITLIIFEHLFLYYFFSNGIFSTGKNAIGLFLSSTLFGVVLIYKFYNATIQEAAARPVMKNMISYIALLLLIAGLIIFGIQSDTFFSAHKIDHSTSDIIPTIQIMCRRFLTGKYPYSIFGDFGFDQQPTYLPMQWMPFTIAELLHIDYRWVTYIIWCIAAVVLCIRSIKIKSLTLRALIPIMIYGSYYVLFSNCNIIIESTVELMISAYYMMLIVNLNKKNGILQGIVFSLCLLSRYSVVLWIPLYCFILFVTNNRRQLYLSAITATVIIIVFYVIPFLSKDWEIFYKGYKYYDSSAYFEWTHLNKQGYPIHLFSGTGFAYYFYTRFANHDIMGRIKLLQKAQVMCSIAVTILMGGWFWFKKEKINHKIFIMSSFKIYLAVFLFLIQVPYEYLMCVGNFVSIAIFCEQARYQVIKHVAKTE